jgi:hypothetical protein
MLFNGDGRVFESYKERNLYFKFFAGYFFNELIPGHEERLSFFANLVASQLRSERDADYAGIVLSPNSTIVSFDNHVVQFERKKRNRAVGVDRGEFADILIRDLRSKVLIAIEAKYRSPLVARKDVEKNWARILQANKHIKAKSVVQCLLVAGQRSKGWEDKSHKHHLIVLTWEQFLGYECDPAVRRWLRRQLRELNRK